MQSISNNRILTGFVALSVAFALAFGVLAHSAAAQVPYTTGYVPRTQDETIAYLNGIIAGMLAQLGATRPGGLVLGESYSVTPGRPSGVARYDIEVGTSFLRSSDDELELNGIIDLDGAPYADVWFEYGTDDDDLDERTRRERIRSGTRFTIEVDKDDFDEDEWYYYRAVAEGPSGSRDHGNIRALYVSDTGSRSSRDDDEPDVETGRAEDIDEDSAELTGEVDMNDFDDGIVFFVYGEDEDQIEDVERDYDSYRDVDEDGDDLQKELVDSNFDGRDDLSERVTGLDEDTDYFFQLCVEYEDEDDDEVLECGGVEDFTTDED